MLWFHKKIAVLKLANEKWQENRSEQKICKLTVCSQQISQQILYLNPMDGQEGTDHSETAEYNLPSQVDF